MSFNFTHTHTQSLVTRNQRARLALGWPEMKRVCGDFDRRLMCVVLFVRDVSTYVYVFLLICSARNHERKTRTNTHAKTHTTHVVVGDFVVVVVFISVLRVIKSRSFYYILLFSRAKMPYAHNIFR